MKIYLVNILGGKYFNFVYKVCLKSNEISAIKFFINN
jgi:hypothetical protein